MTGSEHANTSLILMIEAQTTKIKQMKIRNNPTPAGRSSGLGPYPLLQVPVVWIKVFMSFGNHFFNFKMLLSSSINIKIQQNVQMYKIRKMQNYKKGSLPGSLDVRVMPGCVSPAQVIGHNHHQVGRGRLPEGA